MLTTFLRWFHSPIFPQDEEKTRQAMLLNVVQNTFLIAFPLVAIGAFLGGDAPRFERIFVTVVCAWLTIFVTRLIMISGRVTLAGKLMAAILFGATTLAIYNLGTIRAPTTSFYFLVIVMSGLVIGRRAIIWVSALSALTVILFSLAERNGLLPQPSLGISITQSVTFTVIFGVIGILLYLAVKSIDEALTRARKSEQLYSSLLENIPTITYIIRIGQEPLNATTYASPQIEKVFGYSSEEFVKDPLFWAKVVHPDDVERVMAESARADQTGEPLTTEYRIISKEKKIRWGHDESTLVKDEQGQPLYRVGVWSEITERKQAEEKLRASEERFRAMIEHISDAIALVDGQKTILYLSQAAERILGFTNTERIGSSAFDNLAQAEDVLALQQTFEKIKAEPHITHSFTLQARHKNGSLRWIEATAKNLLNLASVQAIVINYRDITERKQAEKEREKYVEELARQNAELERFTYTVSHDLRNPLVTIKGFLGALEKDLLDGRQDRIQSDFQRIASAADKMHALLSELLELSRIGRIINPPEKVDLVQLTQEARENLNARLNTKNVQVHISSDIPVVYGDRIRLREVLENLIDNAAKYTGNQTDPVIEVGVRTQENETVIFVKDNGLGIEPKYHTRIFGLFEKLNPTSEGTGIGLALVHRIIETHGGKVWAESEGLGRGSTFCFTLPSIKQ